MLSDQGIRKKNFKNFDFLAAPGEKLQKQVVYQSLGSPPPPPTRTRYPNKVQNTKVLPKTCFTYLGWLF